MSILKLVLFSSLRIAILSSLKVALFVYTLLPSDLSFAGAVTEDNGHVGDTASYGATEGSGSGNGNTNIG
ncbi:MAG: hypothetical protein ACREC0_14185 [Methylocella sp.]